MAAPSHDDAAGLRKPALQEPGVSRSSAPVRNRKRCYPLRDRPGPEYGRSGIAAVENIGGAGSRRKKSPANRAFLRHRGRYSIGLMLVACGPLGPLALSYETFWFSFRVLKPLPWIAEKCAKRSLPPSSGVMKPKPLESFNHLTLPVLMCRFFLKI